jgi:hypothetical protein
MTRRRIAVVHLVWGPAGLAPFEAFLASYEQHDAGAEHDLVLLVNGVADAEVREQYRSRAADLAAGEIVLAKPVLDLAAYAEAARRLDHDRVCFLNSYSEIATAGWLGLLEAALADPAAGAAGASGSWASHLSYNQFQLGLPGPYAQAFAGRRAARESMHALSGTPVPGAARHWLYTLVQTVRHVPSTSRFPAPHLRTNAFLVDRARFLALRTAPAATKWDTYRLESGPRSITAQLRAAGTPPVVVDARGVARRPQEWDRGDVFFQAMQEDLLVTDNQTRSYASATPEQRAMLSAFAWGPAARPS